MPTPGIRLEGVAGHRVREALEAAAALSSVATVLTAIARAIAVAKRSKEIAFVVEIRQRCLQHVAHADRHAPARVEVSVGLDRY